MKRITLLSNKLDKHGDILTDGAVRSSLEQMNGQNKMIWTMNHRRDLPPLGRIVDGKVEEQSGYLVLTGAPQKYDHRQALDWNPDLIMEYFETPSPLLAVNDIASDKPHISIDHSNFPSYEQYIRFCHRLRTLDHEMSIEAHGRKTDIPDPELIIALAKTGVHGWLAAYLLKPIIEKLAENVIDDVYEESKKGLKVTSDYVVRLFKICRGEMLPKNRVMTTVFDIPGVPHVELIIKSDDPTMISIGLQEKRLQFVREEIQKFQAYFAVAKIQFLQSKTGRWKFNYLLTEKGEVVGRRISFKERDKLFQRFQLQNLEFPGYTSMALRETQRLPGSNML